MRKRMAKNAPPATMAVALTANKTRKLSFIRAAQQNGPRGATRRPLLERSKPRGRT